MKLLVLASALDLSRPFGCTPAWWQLLKALAGQQVEIVAVPYHGRPVESLWWRTEKNPGFAIGAAYEAFRRVHQRRPRGHATRAQSPGIDLRLVRSLVTPRWQQHLLSILERDGDFSAVLILTVPLNHIAGIATAIRERFGIPICFFDADLPSSLPEHGGFGWGFDMYHGADVGEYDLFLSNSTGAVDQLRRWGARRVEVLWWGADPDVFRPVPAEEDIDVLFYGVGVEHRRDQLHQLVTLPSRELPHRRFAVAGRDLDMDLGWARHLGLVPPSRLNALAGRARLNLNVSRLPHASCYASATTRLFELAAMERAIVTSPVSGIEEWFAPGCEVEVVSSAEGACAAYERLLGDAGARREMGRAARQRVVAEHTYDHRAAQLLGYLRPLVREFGSSGPIASALTPRPAP